MSPSPAPSSGRPDRGSNELPLVGAQSVSARAILHNATLLHDGERLDFRWASPPTKEVVPKLTAGALRQSGSELDLLGGAKAAQIFDLRVQITNGSAQYSMEDLEFQVVQMTVDQTTPIEGSLDGKTARIFVGLKVDVSYVLHFEDGATMALDRPTLPARRLTAHSDAPGQLVGAGGSTK